MEQYRTTVIGVGSVGLGVAASLATAGQDVTLLARGQSVSALRDGGIRVCGMLGDHNLPPGRVVIEAADAPSDRSCGCDMLVITTKTHDIAEALEPFSKSRPRPVAVLTMQNGLGASETVRVHFGPDIPIYASSVMIGLERQDAINVQIKAAAGPILVGPLLGDAWEPIENFADTCREGFMPIKVDRAIQSAVLFKLLFNSCLNPTGALTSLTYGELITDAGTRALMARLADETLATFDANYGYCPASSGNSYIHDILAPAVLSRSAKHRSSMLQDIMAGRKTEIATINGAIIRLGLAHSIPTPTHDIVSALVTARYVTAG